MGSEHFLLGADEVAPDDIDRPGDVPRLAIAILLAGILLPTAEVDELEVRLAAEVVERDAESENLPAL